MTNTPSSRSLNALPPILQMRGTDRPDPRTAIGCTGIRMDCTCTNPFHFECRAMTPNLATPVKSTIRIELLYYFCHHLLLGICAARSIVLRYSLQFPRSARCAPIKKRFATDSCLTSSSRQTHTIKKNNQKSRGKCQAEIMIHFRCQCSFFENPNNINNLSQGILFATEQDKGKKTKRREACFILHSQERNHVENADENIIIFTFLVVVFLGWNGPWVLTVPSSSASKLVEARLLLLEVGGRRQPKQSWKMEHGDATVSPSRAGIYRISPRKEMARSGLRFGYSPFSSRMGSSSGCSISFSSLWNCFRLFIFGESRNR